MLSEVKRKSYNIITLCIFIILFIGGIWSVNNILTNFVEKTNIVCAGQKFASVDEAIFAMESYEREINDTDLDYCPPYKVIYSFNYEKNIIVLYSYCYSFDGKESSSYAIRILKLNEDGTLSFDSGFAEFYMTEPNGNENYYYFTNIKTTQSSKSISFLYLPKDSDKNVFELCFD